MPQVHSLSFRTSAEQARKLDRLMEATQRPRSWLLQQALDDYLERQAWQIDQIAKGLDELRDGHGVSHKPVADWLTTWGDDDEGAAPE